MAQILKNHGAKWELSKGHKLTPVLAVGSNAAPVQLGRKFDAKKFPDGVVIPVLRCVLPDFDVVYAPLISSYGSCTGACLPPLRLPPSPPLVHPLQPLACKHQADVGSTVHPPLYTTARHTNKHSITYKQPSLTSKVILVTTSSTVTCVSAPPACTVTTIPSTHAHLPLDVTCQQQRFTHIQHGADTYRLRAFRRFQYSACSLIYSVAD